MLVFVLNFILFAVTVWAYVGCFRTPEGGWSVRQGLGALRFFTLLSNLFCALAALLTAVGILLGGVSHGVWLMKYIGTAAVTTRGLGVEDMDLIAEYITLVLNDYENSRDKVRAGVEAMCKKYPLYE